MHLNTIWTANKSKEDVFEKFYADEPDKSVIKR